MRLQQRAIDLALRAKDYACLLGMPGTGKTATIAFLVRCLVALGQSVLVTAYTHTAVDSVLLKVRVRLCTFGTCIHSHSHTLFMRWERCMFEVRATGVLYMTCAAPEPGVAWSVAGVGYKHGAPRSPQLYPPRPQARVLGDVDVVADNRHGGGHPRSTQQCGKVS